MHTVTPLANSNINRDGGNIWRGRVEDSVAEVEVVVKKKT